MNIESQADYVEWYIIHICENVISHINAKDLLKAPRTRQKMTHTKDFVYILLKLKTKNIL